MLPDDETRLGLAAVGSGGRNGLALPPPLVLRPTCATLSNDGAAAVVTFAVMVSVTVALPARSVPRSQVTTCAEFVHVKPLPVVLALT